MTNDDNLKSGREREPVPLLANGDRMKQPEFHRRYEEYPGDAKFELIGGIVYMASPARWLHGQFWNDLSTLLGLYCYGTPGVEAGNEATAILGEESEPQPDLALRIHQGCGGQSTVNDDGYVTGPPELLAEIAYSSRAIDLNQKRQGYEQAGVLEYLVLSIEDERLFWFHFPSGTILTPDRKGVLRSIVFPGLWINEEALLARDPGRIQDVLQKGLASKTHRTFANQLAKRRQGP